MTESAANYAEQAEYDAFAEDYDIWLVSDPALEASHDFYVRLCTNAPGVVVELGVGTGRIAVDVARQHKAITGVDIAERMLQQCQERARQAGVTDYLDLLCCDVRDLQLPQKADLIIMPYRMIAHFLTLEEKKNALQRVYTQLAPGGRVVLDHHVFDEERARKLHGMVQAEYCHDLADGMRLRIWDMRRYDFAAQQTRCLLTFERLDGQGEVVTRSHSRLNLSWIHPHQLAALVAEAGYAVEAVQNGFANEGTGAGAAEQIWYLRRPQ